MEVDTDQQEDAKKSENDNETILTLLQIIASIANLQIQFEVTAYSNLAGTQDMLSKLAEQVVSLIDRELTVTSK